MTERNHVIFRPNGDVVAVKALKWDGTRDAAHVIQAALSDGGGRIAHWPSMVTGQWLAVSESGEVWVLDSEPVWVTHYEWTWGWATEDAPSWLAKVVRGSFDARPFIGSESIAPVTRYRRAVMSKPGMTGPWVEVTP